jgi:hypothetical protein
MLRISAPDPDRRPSIVTRKRVPFVEEFPAVRIPPVDAAAGHGWAAEPAPNHRVSLPAP